MLVLRFSAKMKKDVRRMEKRGKDMSLLREALDLLVQDVTLPSKYRDHALSGRLTGQRECHLEPDWLLMYKIDHGELILTAMATGTHADLFGL